jgi:predicted AAA+ superfamily ATPase
VISTFSGQLNSQLNYRTYRLGRLYENFVVTQLIQQLDKKRSDLKIYHYRDKANRKIDIILQANFNSPPIALEIKATNEPKAQEFENLKWFKGEYPNSQVFVIYRASEPFEEKGLFFGSLSDILEKL